MVLRKYAPDSNSCLTVKLGYLTEECGEVLAALGKTIRYGLDSVNPELPREKQERNAAWLYRELQDLKYAIALTEEELTEEGQPDGRN